MRAGASWRWRCAVLCWLLAAGGARAARKRKRLSVQNDNSQLIQHIKDKLVDDNEDYLSEEFPEAEVNLEIGLKGTITEPEFAQFDFKLGYAVADFPEKDSQKETGLETTKGAAKLALRIRDGLKKKRKTKTTQTVPTAASAVWDPDVYLPAIKETKRVKLRPKEDTAASKKSPATVTRGARTRLFLMNVDPRAAASMPIVVYNFYPVTQTKRRAGIKERLGRARRAVSAESRSLREAMPPSPRPRPRPQRASCAREEPPAGLVSLTHRAEIPVEVPLSRRWVANAFS